MKRSSYALEITVFIVGAVIMIFELTGSRVLGPYFGTSIFVWTSIIGIILGSLSLGYYYGGRIADKQPSFTKLSFIIFQAGIFIGLMIIFKEALLNFLHTTMPGIRMASVVASVILFFPASFLLGMVSPYAAKLKLSDLKSAGTTLGNLYAISTSGSIFGTFLCGFYLIPHFGTNTLLMTLSLALIALSLLLFVRAPTVIEVCIVVACVVGWNSASALPFVAKHDAFIDIDTAYNRIWIYDVTHPITQKKMKILGINNENHSAMYLDSDELVNEYTKFYHLAKHFRPSFASAVLFGGAGYSFPKDYLVQYPEATLDVVEIDPKMTELAKQYFRLKDDPRLTTYHQDGRVFLNKTDKKYDVVFGDAFGSRYSIPYQLTTQEAAQKTYDILNEDGIAVLNVINAIEGKGGKFLRAEYATFKSVFPQVYVFPVSHPDVATATQNIILVALKTTEKPSFTSSDSVMNEYLSHLWTADIPSDVPILTDNFAPVDHYVSKAF
ncbi:MAG: fused MFS/spermidine synthase [bacterium]|nr:fused MFS/spermidine synthase [bacterium]MDA1292179.1 fused MFS/spermidine synthase [bacterium]